MKSAWLANNVRARAPLRLGLAGGATDLPDYCNTYGGAVLNATIDRYAYAHLTLRDAGDIVFKADDLGQEERLPRSLDFDITEGLVLHRAVYRHMMVEYNQAQALPMTITTTIDVPAGSGLGASSSLTVALISAFAHAMQLPLGPYEVARLAFDIERRQLAMAGGMQDQYAASFGGLNFIEFLKDEMGVIVNPLRLRRSVLNEFESSLVACFSGQSRNSSKIILQQLRGIKSLDLSKLESMHEIKRHAQSMKIKLIAGDINGVAEILKKSWLSKRQTAANVSTGVVDQLMSIAFANGAMAGKVSGAGGGGFIMFVTDPERRLGLIRELNAAGGEASAVKLTFDGAEAWSVPG